MITKILATLNNTTEREELLNTFNVDSRQAYIKQITPLLLEASVSIGCAQYHHAYSKKWAGGFQVKIQSEKNISPSDIRSVGENILSDTEFVRKLIAFGWDTLEVYDSSSTLAAKWCIRKSVV